MLDTHLRTITVSASPDTEPSHIHIVRPSRRLRIQVPKLELDALNQDVQPTHGAYSRGLPGSSPSSTRPAVSQRPSWTCTC
jgi:hypothetical protein